MIRQLPQHRSGPAAAPRETSTAQRKAQQAMATPGAGMHYTPPVAPSASSAGGQELPSELRTGVESLSGMDMGNVRVHYGSPLPARLNALAYAQGPNIHLARGEEKHLPHEAWHVVQQMQGKVQPTTRVEGVGVNDDAALEREADRMGTRAVQMKAANGAARPLRRGYSPAVVQRYLMVDTTDFTRRVKQGGQDVDTETHSALTQAINAVQGAGPGTLEDDAHAYLQINQVASEAQLKKWVEDRRGGAGSHPQFGRKQQARYYQSFHDLALALYGWMTAKPQRRVEKALAQQINASPIIEERIDNVLRKVRTWIRGMAGVTRANIKAGLKGDASVAAWKADYIQWFNGPGAALGGTVPTTPYTVLKNPAGFNMREKIAILHDVMKFFMGGSGTAGADVLQEGGGGGLVDFDAFKATTSTGRQTYQRPTSSIINRDPVTKLALVTSRASDEEAHPSFTYARSQGIPMWARHSFTAARMMRLAQQAGADHAEVAAVGYAIVAFWRVHYDHRSLPYHTLHEVLDFAPHFGTPYNPQTRYQDVTDELEPLAPLMLRLNAVANSPNWNGKAYFNKGNKAPATVLAIQGVLAGGGTDGEKLDQIRPLVADKTGFNLIRSGKAATLYRILATLPVNTHDHYEDVGATRSQKERIAASLRVVLQGLKAFQP
jgi:hypothetical protein